MDLEEIRRIIFRRVQNLDSENALKVVGYLLLQGRGEQDMLQLAICSDTALRSIVTKAYHDLGFTPAIPVKSGSPNPDSSNSAVSSSYHFESTFQAPSFSPSSPLDLQDFNSFSSQMSKVTEEDTSSKLCYSYLQSQLSPQYQHLSGIASRSLEPWQFDTGLHQGSCLNSASLFSHSQQNINTAFSPHYSNKLLQSATSYPLMTSSLQKPCLYFARGYCKHGNNCRFLHNASSSPAAFMENQRDRQSTDTPRPFTYSTGTASSLDSLESELRELLRERKVPVSIASLPQLYFEKFGKTLQADGYLTESQRHGKPGFSLTKLLSKLKSSVMVIDRPHGQHAVILVEDESKYKEPPSPAGNHAALNSFNAISRQIYLTFPAESTFKEEDVIVHFRAYGPVHDVRIPYQQKRMFGFVTFMYSETVTTILAEGNPHYICGCRVLVKPYKDKVKLNERKPSEESALSIGSASCFYNLFPSAVPKYGKNGDDYSKGFVTGNTSEEDQILALESNFQDLKLEQKNGNNNNNNNMGQDVVKVAGSGSFCEASATSTFYCKLEDEQSRSIQPDNDVPLTAEDCFQLEPSVFNCVLNVLEGDGKEEYAELTNNRHSPEESDWKVLGGDPFMHYKTITETSSKGSLVNKQTPLSTPPYNWNEPTLFAWSVY